MSNGKLFVIEGIDGSGKATQTKMIVDRLKAEGYNVCSVSFPDYDSYSSYFVKEYLKGSYPDGMDEKSSKVASMFYASDRYDSFYKSDWGKVYREGGIVICDRYTTSNIIHQASKMQKDKWGEFIDWVEDLEYNIFKIPKPDKVLFLDIPVTLSVELRKSRIKEGNMSDIHEINPEYLGRCRVVGNHMTTYYSNWDCIKCYDDEVNPKMRNLNDINETIYKTVRDYI